SVAATRPSSPPVTSRLPSTLRAALRIAPPCTSTRDSAPAVTRRTVPSPRAKAAAGPRKAVSTTKALKVRSWTVATDLYYHCGNRLREDSRRRGLARFSGGTYIAVKITFDPAKREATLRERRIDFLDATQVFARRHINVRDRGSTTASDV